MDTPITEFFDDESLMTVEKAYAYKYKEYNKIAKTAICTFLDDKSDKKILKNILKKSKFLFGVLGRSGKMPVYLYKEKYLLVFMTVGSPVSVAVVDELKYFGIQNIITFGTAGLIDDKISSDSFVVVEKAIRDEGASYHYLPPSLYIETDAEVTNIIEKVLTEKKVKVVRGITWTTDAIYRETAQRMKKRKQQGAVAVEMECAGFAAASKKSGIRFGQFLFFSDCVDEKLDWEWIDGRKGSNKYRSLKAELIDVAAVMADEIELLKSK